MGEREQSAQHRVLGVVEEVGETASDRGVVKQVLELASGLRVVEEV